MNSSKGSLKNQIRKVWEHLVLIGMYFTLNTLCKEYIGSCNEIGVQKTIY